MKVSSSSTTAGARETVVNSALQRSQLRVFTQYLPVPLGPMPRVPPNAMASQARAWIGA